MAKTIITAALTGAVTPAGYKIPETPQQIANEAYDAWKLGAAVVHLHMRAGDGLGAMDKEKFRETIKLIRSHKDCDVIINCTSSGASPEHPATDDERDGLGLLRSRGFKTAALALRDDSYSLGDERLAGIDKLAMLFGTEGDGLANDTIEACDMTVRIPMQHGVDSLNVAAATAVAFWELRA